MSSKGKLFHLCNHLGLHFICCVVFDFLLIQTKVKALEILMINQHTGIDNYGYCVE